MSFLGFNDETDRPRAGPIGSGPTGDVNNTPALHLRLWRHLVRRAGRTIDRPQVTRLSQREGRLDGDDRRSPVEPDADRRRRELQQYLAPHALWPIRQSGPRRR